MFKVQLLSILLLVLGFTSPAHAGSSAASLNARVKLMEYAIRFEKTHPVHANKIGWNAWFQKISVIPDAGAYANGEACLVLGFESTFSDNLCKLSTAEGAKDYLSSCAGDSLPCNPAVFGKAEGSKVFCASSSAGNQLSKSCAFQTFQYLDEKTNHALGGFSGQTEKTFDLSKLDFSNANAFADATKALFGSDDASLASAFAFTQKLCQDIGAGKKTGNQPKDFQTCQRYLSFLEKAKPQAVAQTTQAPVTAPVQQQVVVTPPVVNRAPAVVTSTQAPSISSVVITASSANSTTPVAEVCTVNTPQAQMLPASTNTQIQNLVSGLQSADTTNFAQLNACLKGLESQPEIPPGKKGVYWKQIDGVQTFSMRCNRMNDDPFVSPLKYAFLTDTGFKKLQFPKVSYITHYDNHGVPASETVSLPRQNASFKAGNTTYYVNMDQGDSFNMATAAELNSVSSDRFGTIADTVKYRVKTYTDKLRASHAVNTNGVISYSVDDAHPSTLSASEMPSFNLMPADVSNSDDAWVKTCINERTIDFVGLMLSPAFYQSGDMPNTAQYNADRNLPANSPVLAQRYGKSVDELRESFRAKIISKAPACSTVIDPTIFKTAFDRQFDGQVLQNYQTLHNRIAH